MTAAAIALAALTVALLAGAALSRACARVAGPSLFASLIASLTLGYLAAEHARALPGALALADLLAALGGLIAVLCLPDTRAARWRRFERQFRAYAAARDPASPREER